MAVPCEQAHVMLAEGIIRRGELVIGVNEGEDFTECFIAQRCRTAAHHNAAPAQPVPDMIIELSDSFAAHWVGTAVQN